LILAGVVTFTGCSPGDSSKYFPQALGDLRLAKVTQNEHPADMIKNAGKRLDDCKNFLGYHKKAGPCMPCL